jgi:hypothetical protein
VKRGLVLIGFMVVAAVAIIGGQSAESFTVDGSFILWDEYPGKGDGERCTGERSLYHGINSSTRVTVETVTGEPVAADSLGDGRIASGADLVDLATVAGQQSTLDEVDALLAGIPLVPCLFAFRFTVESAGSGTEEYVVRVGTWGALTMAEEDLRKPGSVQLSVGLR